jgi:oxaloacetate decarboxylase (Na+ extruding) subunit gamma
MQPDVANALTEAANLMFTGMVVVFLFLSMLIGAISLIAWVNKQFPEPVQANSVKPISKNTSSGASSDAMPAPIVAAISAAIQQHRRRH